MNLYRKALHGPIVYPVPQVCETPQALVNLRVHRYTVEVVEQKTAKSFRATSTTNAIPVIATFLLTVVLIVPLFSSLTTPDRLSDWVDERHHQWLHRSLAWAQNLAAGTALDSAELDHTPSQAYRTEILENRRLEQIAQFSPALKRSRQALLEAIAAADRQFLESDNAQAWLASVDAVSGRFVELRRDLEEMELQQSQASESIVFFLVLLAFGFVLLYGVQTVRLRSLRREGALRRRFSRLTQKVQEDERRNLARELHDGVSQDLALARMWIDRLSAPGAQEVLRQTVSRAMQEVRSVTHSLRPAATQTGDVVEMIRELVLFLGERAPVPIHLDLPRELLLDWPEEAMVHLYRIVQEALVNAIRHGDPSHCSVHLRDHGSQGLAVEVQDNGVGIGSAPEGFGRRGIRERAELLGGRVSWHGPASGGTQVSLVVPRDQALRFSVDTDETMTE